MFRNLRMYVVCSLLWIVWMGSGGGGGLGGLAPWWAHVGGLLISCLRRLGHLVG